MNVQGQRDLLLLSEVERDAGVTQRALSTTLGVALGLTNLYLKRLARKGYVKIATLPRNRIQYLLTPQGLIEKSRLTYLYMQHSLAYYRETREQIKKMMSRFGGSHGKRVVIYGTTELPNSPTSRYETCRSTVWDSLMGIHATHFCLVRSRHLSR